jgi:tetratricopeptide (TPR) repeat protein
MAAEIDERTQYDWFAIGRAHETKEEYEEAIAAYEQAIKLDPKLAKAWFYKAKLHHKLKQMEEAKDSARKALELEPDWKKHIRKFLPDL